MRTKGMGRSGTYNPHYTDVTCHLVVDGTHLPPWTDSLTPGARATLSLPDGTVLSLIVEVSDQEARHDWLYSKSTLKQCELPCQPSTATPAPPTRSR
jgi:hypothetical protein